MIFVLTRDHRQYLNFCDEFNLRADGRDSHAETRYLSNPDQLRGHRSAIVLTWAQADFRRDYWEIRDYCTYADIPFLNVPDLKRARYFNREQAEKLKKL